jgi:hypothetical protein
VNFLLNHDQMLTHCASGFNLYNIAIYSYYPCVSTLSQAYSVPAAVSQQLLSLSAAIAGTATNANPTVSVHIVTDSVFALSLPLRGGVERVTQPTKAGLPLPAKIGIAVGAVLIFIVLGVLILLCITARRRKRVVIGGNRQQTAPLATQQTPAWLAAQRESLASATTAAATPGTTWEPHQGHFRYDSNATATSDTAASDTAAGGYYKPTSDNSPYVRTPPPRNSLQPMPVAQISPYGHVGGVQPTYSELPAASHEVFEADANQPYVGYSDNTAYQGPAHGHQSYEMGGVQQQQPHQPHQPEQPHQPQQRNNEWL